MSSKRSALSVLLGLTSVVLSAQSAPPFRLVDVTRASGVAFTHNNGAFGKKFLPETLGAGAAFLDYDRDGRQDLLLVNGSAWPGQPPARSYSRLYRNEGGGRFTDTTKQAGLEIELYGMGVAAADYDNDGWPDIVITAVGQNRLFRNGGQGRFADVTDRAGLGKRDGFSTSALWLDYDRDGWLDLLVCNYVKWTPETDVFCSVDGKQKSYCTPEAYRGTTSWLFRNKGNGTFEDATAKAGLFDATSKSLGVTLIDYDQDVWPDLFIANDTQPNKLYRNNGNGTFTELGLQAGLAFSEEGRARAGMGVDAADVDNTGRVSVVVTNFSGEMLGLYRPVGGGQYADVSPRSEIGRATRNTLGFGCFFFDVDLDGLQDLLVVNGHIDDTIGTVQARVTYAEPPHLFRNVGSARFEDVAASLGGTFGHPKVGRGAAFGDFDGDSDPDVVITTNGGPVFLYRNDVLNANRAIRLTLRGTTSNRDAIGATVRVTAGGQRYTKIVKTGSSYLSQSELPLTFGLGARASADRVQIEWPSGARQELTALAAGVAYEIVEGQGIAKRTPLAR
jgi:enediyne biosynthesis protein E4